MKENKLADMSTEFAVKSANIREAKYAHSKADFVAKLQISLKY